MKTISLCLLLVCGSVCAVCAADVSVYALTKTRGYQQASPAAPASLATGGFAFAGIVSPTTTSPASVTGATLKLPSAVVKTCGPVPGFGPFAVVQAFDTQALLDGTYADGSYLFTIAAVNDGTKTPALTVNGDAYPNAPTVTNFTAAQSIDWTQPFTLQWGGFAGGTGTDTIQLLITRKDGTTLFSTPQFPNAGALNGTATSATIPAGTFVPGEPYTATLIFGKIVGANLTSYPGVPGVSAYASTTEFPMKAPGTVPVLVISSGGTPGSFDLTWNADIGRTYDLVWSPDLVGWTRLFLVTASAATETQNDTPGTGVAKRFYRLQDPP